MPQNYSSVSQEYAKYIDPAFIKLLSVFGYGRLFTRAQSSWVYDDTGKNILIFYQATEPII